MDKKKVQQLGSLIRTFRSEDQSKLSVHENVLKCGIEEIQKRVLQLQENAGEIKLETSKEWARAKELITVTLQSLQFLLEILQSTEDQQIIRFRQSKDILPRTMDIAEVASDMVNKLSVQIARNFSVESCKHVIDVTRIPPVLDDILGFMTPEDPTDLSDSSQIDGIQPLEIKAVRIDLFRKSATFSSNMCEKMLPVLQELRRNKSRSVEAFKPFLVCVLKQYLFVQRASALSRELLKFTTDTEWKSEIQSYTELFQEMKHILTEGRRIICSLCPLDGVPSDFQEVIPPKCSLIRECYNDLNAFTGRSKEELNSALKHIEVACDGISKASEYGQKCLPPGEEYLGEDVVLETGSDFDPDFDPDFDQSVKKASIGEYEEVTKDTSILPTELVGIYKLNNIPTNVKVTIDHRRPLACPKIKGQIIKSGKKSRVPLKVEGTNIGLSLTKSGDFLLLLYDFPVTQSTFEPSDVKKGVTVDVEGDASCSISVTKKDIREKLNLKYTIHNTDKDRIEGYKEENPEEFGMIDIPDGIYLETNVDGVDSKLNFKDRSRTEMSSYFKMEVHMDGASKKRKWKMESLKCSEDKDKGTLSIPISLKTLTYVVMVSKEIPVPDNDSTADKSKIVREKTLTLLGIKSKCKTLILYRFPCYEDWEEGEEEEENEEEVEIHVECIESQRYFLHKRANILRENGKWIQFEDGDESADFLISERNSLEIEIKGNARVAKHYPSRKIAFPFLKNSSCFIELPVEVPIDKKQRRAGYVYCCLSSKVVHWRALPWMTMKKRYKDALKSKMSFSKEQRKQNYDNRQEKQKETEIGFAKGIESVVNEMFNKLTTDEKEKLKKGESMGGSEGQSLIDRFVTHVRKEKDCLKYLMNALRKLGRDDLVLELTERVERYGKPE